MTVLLFNTDTPVVDYPLTQRLPNGMTFSRSGVATMFDAAGKLVFNSHNLIRNSTMAGGAAGSPGTLPTNWSTSALGGLTRSLSYGTEYGMPYIDVRLNGTPTAAYQQVAFETASGIAGAQGVVFTESVFARIVGGSLSNVTSFKLNIAEFTSAQAYITDSVGDALTVGEALTRFTFTRTQSNAAAAYARPIFLIYTTIGQPVDITVRFYAPQMERTAYNSPTVFQPTSSAAYYGPRFDTNPSTLAARGLRLEVQSTNHAFNSTASKYKINRTIGQVSPSGLNDAYLCNVVSTTDVARIGVATTALGAGTYSLSAFVKLGTGITKFQLMTSLNNVWANFDLSNLTVPRVGLSAIAGSARILVLPNGWYRLSFVYTTALTGVTYTAIRPLQTGNESQASALTWAGTETFITYGEQLETAPYVTSYIPTTTVSATRLADTLYHSTPPWLNASQGAFVTELEYMGVDTGRLYTYAAELSDGTSNNLVATGFLGTPSSYLVGTTVAGTTTISAVGATVVPFTVTKIGLAYKSGANIASVNGTTLGTGSYGAVNVPAGLNRVNFLNREAGDRGGSGWIRSFKYYNYMPQGELNLRTK